MQNKKKLLFVVEAMGGGVFTYIVDLANQLVNSYDMYIAYAMRDQTPIDFKNYFDSRINLIRVENFVRVINPLKDIKAFLELRKIVKQVNPDIVHLHSSKAGVLGRVAINGHEIPMFYTPHGYSFLMSDSSKLKRLIYKTIEQILGKRYCTTISCSEGEHKETKKLTKKAKYVNNGINIKELSKLVENTDEKVHPLTVFTIGRICYQKNPKLFNEVAERLPNINFVWIGDGELRNELRATNIKVTGWMDRNSVIKYSRNADVFLLTSLWEGLPISLLEAMYMKKLCIVSDVVGNHDVIHSGENGYVCKAVDEFVKSIMCFYDKNTNCLIDNAYTAIQKEYNTKVMSNKYSSIYQDYINSNWRG